MRIMLSPDLKTINKIEFESNAEDPEFWQRVLDSGIFKKYLNRTPAEALRLPIDAVTGATFSSRAAQETIRARLAETVSAPLAVETPSLITAAGGKPLLFLSFDVRQSKNHPACLQYHDIRLAYTLLPILIAIQRMA